MMSSWILNKPERKTIWLSWLFLCIAVSVIHLQTLEIDPLINQDEVQIIDLGRTMLDQSTDWATTWHVQGSHPSLLFSYFGIVLQEIAFTVTSPSNLGPRFLAMLAAIFAATTALGWLMSRGTPPIISMVLALAFLTDPVFSDIYRGGRIDGWAMAASLACCWLLRIARDRGSQGLSFRVHTFIAGVLVAISFFFWISAAILLPLVLLECFYLAKALNQTERRGRGNQWIPAALFFCFGGILATVIWLIPIVLNLEIFLSSTKSVFEAQRIVAGIKNPVFGLFAIYDPAFLVAVIIAFFMRRELGLIIAFAAALLLIYQTAIYLPRILYLVPYGLAAIGYSFSKDFDGRHSRYANLARNAALIFLISYNSIQVLAIRPVIASAQKPANLPQQFFPELKKAIGPGPYRVLLEEWPVYYAGRELGWHMFLFSSRVSENEYTEFLKTMDYVIIKQEFGWYGTYDNLEPAGFELKSSVQFAIPASTESTWGPFKFDVPQYPYNTLDIYGKKTDMSATIE
jgi:hypothetical protein